jgi:chaperone required for assembly of F1-ATPase
VKRFWKEVTVEPGGDGWTIELDGRPVKTPARAALVVPTSVLADRIADEWREVADTIDPRAMPLTGLANAAIDRVAPDRHAFAQGLARYAEADLLCYRAEGPRALVELQQQWDGLLDWARRRYDVDFVVTAGIVHLAQPPATISRLSHAIAALDPFQLAGLSPLVTVGSSVITALAVVEKAISADAAWAAVTVDECWQLDQWGADAEAELVLENRRSDFLSGARFLDLLD